MMIMMMVKKKMMTLKRQLNQPAALLVAASIPNRKVFCSLRSLTQLVVFALLIYLCYVLGLFTHLLERDLAEFKYPREIDIRVAIETLKQQNFILDNNKNHHSHDDEMESSLSNLDVYKLNHSFLLDAQHVCKSTPPTVSSKYSVDPYLVILVKSKYSHFRNREAIRNTWGQSDAGRLIRLVFLIGLPQPSNLLHSPHDLAVQNEIEQLKSHNLKPVERYWTILQKSSGSGGVFDRLNDENRMHADLVQQDFHDTYYNNTLKTLMGLKWVNNYCANSKFYLFIDDDYYLNPRLLINEYLEKNVSKSALSTFYAGFVFANSSPMRHKLSKWYVSLNEYPYSKYPPYVSAGCYLMTLPSVRLFYMASKLIELFRLDDIYMGILAHKLDIKPTHLDNIYFYPPAYSPDLFAEHVIAAHRFELQQLKSIWQQLESRIRFLSLN